MALHPLTRTRHLLAALGTAALLAACATSTAPGAVGIQRQQLLMVPAATVNAEAAKGFNQLSSAASSKGKLNNDPVITKRVRDIGFRLIKEVPVFRPDAAQWAWEINVFDAEEVNAFCAPGGKIGVYTGIVRKLDLSDDELAAVMGHEIAHALREHSREQVSQQALSGAVVQGIAASSNSSAAGALAAVGAQFFLHLPFSRDMELEADVMGVELMARAGYDPRAAPNVWRKMQRLAGGQEPVQFFSTHPNSSNRIAALEAAVPKVMPLYQARAVGTPAH
ncbi:M48 family metallopeptidase [uncultured Azohydromonas sp.]|jgi:Putative Zn-dependent protease, contains TPR repeats|uniref:M48 family metallopeptidase n=1 Tax=uncultured Azohydromonas sp. TaxID=487342 RepID=UPI00262FB907|nr:M48 family metallopeptidase [uncultured Azohydromonas sp.]